MKGKHLHLGDRQSIRQRMMIPMLVEGGIKSWKREGHKRRNEMYRVNNCQQKQQPVKLKLKLNHFQTQTLNISV